MKKKRAGFAALLCTLLIVLDQITKALTVSVLKVHDIVVIPGVPYIDLCREQRCSIWHFPK